MLEGQKVKVSYTLTSMGCPAGAMIPEDIERVVRELPGVEDVESEVTFEPPWTGADVRGREVHFRLLSDAARV